MNIQAVRSSSVWKSIKILLIGSGLLFLINILFGFDNSLTVGELPRGNMLIHLHAGSLGWITLSAIGVAIWMLTGSRDVSSLYERRVRLLVWVSLIAFAGYIPNFWLAFTLGQSPLLPLLPVFGSLTVVLLWVVTVYAFSQLKELELLQTIHLLIVGALFVAAIGGTVGALLGLERVIGRFLPLPDVDRVGAHAGMMDSYLFLLVAAIIEWFTPGERKKWSYAGMAQTVVWVIGAALVPIAFFTGMVPQLVPIFVLLMVIGLIIFLFRVGWRAVRLGPTAKGSRSWVFFSAVWLVVYLVQFMYFAAQTGAGAALPEWFMPVFAHSGYVGMVTNSSLAVHATRGREASHRLAWGEPAALWLINLGLLAFLLPRIFIGTKFGAIVMGLGVLLGVVTVLIRMWSSPGAPAQNTGAAPA